jgi:site-specific DNA recombinase
VKGPSVKAVRCAIYTRVSTDQGLDQEFNSLDAQYEASSAYIKSQAHAGWTMIRSRYDDGGYSGGSTDRPDLQRLLDDIRSRKIDVIVVYKVDRLTRSLADFAKLVELFDAHGVSFVSVTQQFNTTTSMGRLTLNVLLSFAQFEREVTSERIRDKIAASKRKGLWVGGPLPLGYAMKDGKIAVVEVEAERVRMIYRRYLELGAVNALARDLRERDIRTKKDCWRLAPSGAAYCLAGVRYSICCAIASTSARSNTRKKSCRASSLRSWSAPCSMRFSRSLPINGRPEAESAMPVAIF